jgi:seryl-tRNA synthetase
MRRLFLVHDVTIAHVRYSELAKRDEERHRELRTIGNLLHPSVPISDNEDFNGIERIIGETGEANRKKYSHVDLIAMIDGVDTERGVVTAGNRVRSQPCTEYLC